jgi:hypothetical protein
MSVGLIPTLVNTLILGEGGDSHDPPVQNVNENSSDIETIVSTTKHHKERGNPQVK